MTTASPTQSLWGGRFEGASDPLFRQFNDSIAFDATLLAADVEGSRAWAGALERCGVLTAEERATLDRGLAAAGEAGTKDLDAVRKSGEEDVHSWVESRLVKELGAVGRKLHTGRSRNDQVATDLRLWTRSAVDGQIAELHRAIASLTRFAERVMGVIVPGLTHLQHGQPILLSHWALAYVEMFRRDVGRFVDCRARLNECPLGSGALAGTAYAIDRVHLAGELGFRSPTRNSLDAVSDRDFVVEALAASSLCSVHLSRLAEDLIIWSSQEFRLVEMSDAVTSGSSLMPQKKNPDAAELLRGKSGRIVGALMSILTVLKGLPLAYNKDLQEDKEPLFDAMAHLSMCLRIVPPIIDGISVDAARCRDSAGRGYSNATELADCMVGAGVPFREAHDVVGRVVRVAIEKKVALEDLSLEAMRAIDPRIPEGVHQALVLESAIARRDVIGGTALDRVATAIAEVKSWLEAGVKPGPHSAAQSSHTSAGASDTRTGRS